VIKFNFFTGNFDFVGDSGGSSTQLNLPILMADPIGAVDGDAWILATLSQNCGDLIYFHGAMPVTEISSDQFLFSVKTPSGAKRVELL
jgi:hypothetical protein